MPRRLRATHEVDVRRRLEDTSEANVETNEWGSPVAADGESRYAIIAEDVPFAFDDESSEYIRTETGETVSDPAGGHLFSDVDVRENDELVIPDVGTERISGISKVYDRRRGELLSIEVTFGGEE